MGYGLGYGMRFGFPNKRAPIRKENVPITSSGNTEW